jgi:protease I
MGSKEGAMAGELSGRRIAILVTDGFEQIEMTEPRRALEEAGAEVDLVSPLPYKVKGWQSTRWGEEFEVDLPLTKSTPSAYDGLMLPGGVMNADKMRVIPEAREFVRAFFEDDKPVAAICHAPWILIDAGVANGRKMTSWYTLEMDLRNAGVDWTDQQVVVDRKLVTSRKPDDLPAFNREMIKLFSHADQKETNRSSAPARVSLP